MKNDKTKINEILEKIFNMRTINKRITKESLNQNNEKLKKIYLQSIFFQNIHNSFTIFHNILI